ncbi:MAG: hypothetical protein V3R95_02185 [Dehalococcoidia bacterium]
MNSTLVIGLAVGIPLLILGVGLLLNAYLLIGRSRRVTPATDSLDALATQSMDKLLIELQRSVGEIRGQLASQRATLAALLSDGAAANGASAQAPPPRAAQGAQGAAIASPPVIPAETQPLIAGVEAAAVAVASQELHSMVGRLVAEGLSDRAIARRLSIGMEEVRLARLSPGRAS